jgi:FixJ family two-component response regulator
VERLIALIDDDDSYRKGLLNSLCSFGFRVRSYSSAEDFIASADQDSYDCIVTDIHMPGMSGIDLKKLLVARGLTTPVVMVTGRGEPELEDRAAASGAVSLLRKPFSTDALIRVIQRAVEA